MSGGEYYFGAASEALWRGLARSVVRANSAIFGMLLKFRGVRLRADERRTTDVIDEHVEELLGALQANAAG
jgi:hypothetical protein